MVCNRCVMIVQQAFEKAGFAPEQVHMGEVLLARELNEKELATINDRLTDLGFEILDDKNQKRIEQIKTLLITKVQSGDIEEHFSLSEFLSKKLHKDYSQLSRLFSEVEQITVEQFFILQKIEKVKEWLVYDEFNLSEISYKLGYSSVAHLSAQFKKVTGFTPSAFKKLGVSHRKALDKVHKHKRV